MAASGLSFMALMAGMNPAAMPTKMANPMADMESQGGILERLPTSPLVSSRLTNLLMMPEIP